MDELPEVDPSTVLTKRKRNIRTQNTSLSDDSISTDHGTYFLEALMIDMNVLKIPV